jgi:predicted secreted protein
MVLVICALAVTMATESINVAAGGEFAVRLASNPSTAYLWEVQTLPESIELLGSSFEKPAGEVRPGDPSTQVFRFRALKAGEYHIVFGLKRKWETESIKSETIVVHVR